MKKFIRGVIVTAIILSFSLTPLFAQANVCMMFTRSISQDKLNGDEIGGRKFPVLRSISKDLDAFIHSTTKSKVNDEENGPVPSLNSWRDKMLVVGNGPGANGEENCIPVLSNRMQGNIMHGVDTNVEEIELAIEKIERN